MICNERTKYRGELRDGVLGCNWAMAIREVML